MVRNPSGRGKGRSGFRGWLGSTAVVQVPCLFEVRSYLWVGSLGKKLPSLFQALVAAACLDPVFAANWLHCWHVPPWQCLSLPGSLVVDLTRGDLALWSQGCSLRPALCLELLLGWGFLAVITVPACRSCLPGSGWEALLCQNLETLACFKGALPVHLGAS